MIDSSLSAGVYITDIVCILGLKLVELVRAILDGIHLPVYPLFAGEGVHVAPESFLRLILEGLAGGVSGAIGRAHRAGLRGLTRLRRGGHRLGGLSRTIGGSLSDCCGRERATQNQGRDTPKNRYLAHVRSLGLCGLSSGLEEASHSAFCPIPVGATRGPLAGTLPN